MGLMEAAADVGLMEEATNVGPAKVMGATKGMGATEDMGPVKGAGLTKVTEVTEGVGLTEGLERGRASKRRMPNLVQKKLHLNADLLRSPQRLRQQECKN